MPTIAPPLLARAGKNFRCYQGGDSASMQKHILELDAMEAQGIKPFSPPDLHFDRIVEMSKRLNDSRYPTIIISASGMATGAGELVKGLAA